MTSGRNFNSINVSSVSVTTEAIVRNEASKQFYPPWTRVFGNRPPLGNIYGVFNSDNIVTENRVNRRAVPSQVLNAATIFNYNKAPVESLDSRPSNLFLDGSYSQPMLISSGYGSGTIGVVSSGTNEYGTAIWTFNLTNMATTQGLVKGSVIASLPGTGNFGARSTVYVNNVIDNNQVSCIAFNGTGPIQGTVNVIQSNGRILLPQIVRVRLVTGATSRWTFTITGIVGTQSFIPGDIITITPDSGNTGNFGTGNTVYVTKVNNNQELTCETIDGTGAPVPGTLLSISKTGQTVLFTPGEIQVGEAEYTVAGTYQWTAPPGVTSVSVVAVGAGGPGAASTVSEVAGGGGGALAWRNNITVVPGQSYTVVVGEATTSAAGGHSLFIDSTVVRANGGGRGTGGVQGAGGTFVGQGGGNGGGGVNQSGSGGGAGGYQGNGGIPGQPGTGGAGGGGAPTSVNPYSAVAGNANGGGVGIYGQGNNGASGGFGGSGAVGINFGGGSRNSSSNQGIMPGAGVVRIVWGINRLFPTQNVEKTVVLTIPEESPYSNTIISTPRLSISSGTANDVKRQNSISTSQQVTISSTIKGPFPATISRTRMEILDSSPQPSRGINTRVRYGEIVPPHVDVDRYANENWPTFTVGRGSALFDGSGDYVNIPYRLDHTLSNGNFTIEAWIYPTTSGSNRGIINNWQIGGQFVYELRDTNTLRFSYTNVAGSTTTQVYTGTTTIPTNTWTHVAVVRNGASLTHYINGVIDAGGSFNIGTHTLFYFNNEGKDIRIGVNADLGGFFTGSIGSVRIVKGTAVYTSNFTPPTQVLANVTNTILLTLQSEALFTDAARNIVTRIGDTSRNNFDPFGQIPPGTNGPSITNVSIGGAVNNGLARANILSLTEGVFSNVAATVNVTNAVPIGSGPVRIPQVFDGIGAANHGFSTVYTDNFHRPLDNHVANEFTDPVMVYTQSMPITNANRPKVVILNNFTYAYKATVEVNSNGAIALNYAMPATSNAFPITAASKPLIKTDMPLNNAGNQYSFRVNTVTNYTDYIDRRSDPIERFIVTESIVAAQTRTTLYSYQGVNAGLSRSFTSAPFGRAGAILPGDGGQLVLASTEFWV